MPRSLILIFAVLLQISSSFTAAPYCTPGQRCFPSGSEIASFNNSISGRLATPPPYARVCYNGINSTFDLAACQNLYAGETRATFRLELPSALMHTNWELDDNGKGCPQPPAAPTPAPTGPSNGSCTLGALAAYEVLATSAQDVSTAVKFAAKHNLRLRIKNTGHDYLGRSSAPGSFTIWTHPMNSSSFDSSFIPSGCNVQAQPALVLGPGQVVSTLSRAADNADVVAVTGFIPSVGATGGFLLGGGTGPMSRTYGLGVDNALQFQVVTADGSIKIANQCTNTDLFWALRGGGGAFGVATQVVLKAHPPLTGINTVSGIITANSSAAWTVLIREWLALHVTLDQAGFAGISETLFPSLPFVMIQPFVNSTPSTTEESLAFFNNIKSIPGVAANFSVATFPTWLAAYNGAVVPVVSPASLVGVNLILADRVVSKSVMSTNASREPLVQFLVGLNSSAILQFVAGGAVSTADHTATSVHPAWRNALMHINFPIFGTGPVTASQNATVLATAQAADQALFPAGATPVAYYNEDFAHEPDWQHVWWGINYARLLRVKKDVDPNGVFTCRRCVGSEVFGF